jgi:hypothetical protein
MLEEAEAEIERLKADMDARMKAYVEIQEKDELEIARLKTELREWKDRVRVTVERAEKAEDEVERLRTVFDDIAKIGRRALEAK